MDKVNENSSMNNIPQAPTPLSNLPSIDKDKTLNKLRNLQLLIKKESSLKELCK